jgi:hypothetical protein
MVRTALLLVPAVLASVAAFCAIGGAQPGPRPLSLVATTVLGGFALALGSSWLALGRGGRMLGRARGWLVGGAVLAPPVWVLWKLFWSTQYEGMSVPWASRPGARCFALTLGFALLPLLSLAIARKGSDPTHPRSLGAAFGVAAGMYSAVMIDLWCPIGELSHVLLGHGIPVVLLGLLGVLIGQLLLAVRR